MRGSLSIKPARRLLTALAVSVVLSACAHQSVQNELPVVIVAPSVGTPVSSTSMQMADNGYQEREFFLRGEANRYRIKDNMKDAQVIDSGNPYTTRVLVRRPTDPTRFNGTVIVEWLNVTLGQDVDFVFGATRELLVRDGYAWIGVSAQRNGIDAMKKWNPDRYEALNVAASNIDPLDGSDVDPANPLIMAIGGDVLAWDIHTQVAELAKTDSIMLGGLKADKVISASESQSTLKVSTYYNTIQPLEQAYDGYIFYDRSDELRTDVDTKTIAIGTEIFTAWMGYAPQDDNDHQRWWEINGASHFSYDEIQNYVDPFMKRDGAFRDEQGNALNLTERTRINGPCEPATTYSRVPNGDVLKAALHSLDSWIDGGAAPVNTPRFVVDDQNSPQYIRDENGQVLGGIRTAAQDAPMSKNAGISGYHVDFTAEEMKQRYGSHEAYVAKVKAITDANVRGGVLLPEEADKTVKEAEALKF